MALSSMRAIDRDRHLAERPLLVARVAAVAVAAGCIAAFAPPAIGFAAVGGIVLLAGLQLLRLQHAVDLLSREVQDWSSRDPLTGALNDEAFRSTFDAWVGNGTRRNLETSLLVLDIDDFEALVREHGHDHAEAALRHLAQVVGGCIRETDAFGRLAGGHFALLFPATTGAEASIAAERIRAEVQHHASTTEAPFTISIGVTGGNAFQDPWAAAERALSLANAAGRNCVVLAETETQAERLDLSELASPLHRHRVAA